MRRPASGLLPSPLLAASSVAQNGGEPLDAALKAALAEQNNADAATARLEQAAAKAQTEVGRLHAEQVAAAQAIEAAEARIGAATARLQLESAYVAAHRQRLATEQRPVSSLLGGLATMARRPPLLAVADRGGTDELVKVRLLLNATLPVIRSRTSRLSAELAQGERFQRAALAARAELARSRGRRGGCPAKSVRSRGRESAAAVHLSASGRRAGHRRPRLGQRQWCALAWPDPSDGKRDDGGRAGRRGGEVCRTVS